MQAAYLQLHHLGHAHSVEVFDQKRLVGGIYGVAIGRMFFGESMYSGASGGSKVALAGLGLRLHQWGWPLIDAQVENPHLVSLGAESWSSDRFLQQVESLAGQPEPPGSWTLRFGELAASQLGKVSAG